MRRLLVFTENYSRGGGNRYLIDMVNALADEFDDVVIASNRNGIFPEDLKRLVGPAQIRTLHFITKARVESGLGGLPPRLKKIITLPLFFLEPILFIYNLLTFALCLGRLKPSVVLSCNGGYPGGRSCLAMTVASRLRGIPVALSVVSTPMCRKKMMAFYEAFIDGLVWRSADVVIVNAATIAVGLAAIRGMPQESAAIVHNGLPERPLRGQKKRGNNHLTIGCIARTDRAKGVFFLVDAFARLAVRYRDISLILVGKGDAHAELEAHVNASGLKDRIELAGYFTGDMDELIDAIGIYVFPSLQEGFPYSILEAMAAGKAIVATQVGGIPEAITDGVEGLLVAPSSVQALEVAIERLILDATLRNRLGENARLRFTKAFTLDAMGLRMKEVFRKAGLLE